VPAPKESATSYLEPRRLARGTHIGVWITRTAAVIMIVLAVVSLVAAITG
jgi:hypothetical protein